MSENEYTDKEKRDIQLLVEKLSSNSFVECIYVINYFDNETNKMRIEMNIVYDVKPLYNEQLSEEEKKKLNDEFDNLKKQIDQFKTDNQDSRIECYLESDENYNPLMMHKREMLTMRNLVNGTILFDKTGHFKEIREKVFGELEPYNNVVKSTFSR